MPLDLLTAAQPVSLEVLSGGGEGLANGDMTLFREARFYDGKKVTAELHIDASGKFAVRPQESGRYLLLVSHRDTAPSGAGAG